jgi:hypothetical protein
MPMNKYYNLYILIFLFFGFSLCYSTAQAADCHQLDQNSTLPSNYGAPFDVSSQSNLLFKTDCEAASVNIEVGDGSANRYIYKYGYLKKGGAWQKINFVPSGRTVGDWHVGKTTAKIPMTTAELSKESTIVAFFCKWDGSNWSCGCRDSGCANTFWQIQKFKKSANSICTDNDNDGYGVCPDCGKANGCAQDGDDCDDFEYWANPGNANETCDTVDNDCNNQTDEFCDNDGDQHCDKTIMIYRSNSMCPDTPAGDFVNGYFGDDCNDTDASVKPGVAENCTTAYDDNCNNQINENCANSDTTAPQVASFDVIPKTINAGDTVTVSYSVTDNIALSQAELWRAPDNAVDCNGTDMTGCQWGANPVVTDSVSGQSDSGSMTDTPPAGTYWYGMHVVDAAGNVGYEKDPPGPIKVSVNAAGAICGQNGCEAGEDCSSCPVDCGACIGSYTPRNNYGAKFEPVNTVLHCVGQNKVENIYPYRVAIGRDPTTYMHYTSTGWNQNQQITRVNIYKKDLASFSKVTNLQIGMALGDTNAGGAQDVANGLHDANINTFFDELDKLNLPVYLRIGYECNGSWNSYPAADYKNAFIRVVNLLRNHSINNKVAIIWNIALAGDSSYMSWYPGDNYVDWWSFDAFHAYELNSQTKTNFLNDADSHNKPVMIGESSPRDTGVDDGQQDWDAWFDPYFTTIRDSAGIKAFCYINQPWGGTWADSRIQLDPVITGHYKQEMTLPLYQHATQPNPNFDTIKPAVTAFNAAYDSQSQQVVATWSATDNNGLADIELWRASYDANNCHNGNTTGCDWNSHTPVNPQDIISIKYTPLSADSVQYGDLSDPILSGIWLYGLHVMDSAGNIGVEPNPPGPIKVTVN